MRIRRAAHELMIAARPFVCSRPSRSVISRHLRKKSSEDNSKCVIVLPLNRINVRRSLLTHPIASSSTRTTVSQEQLNNSRRRVAKPRAGRRKRSVKYRVFVIVVVIVFSFYLVFSSIITVTVITITTTIGTITALLLFEAAVSPRSRLLEILS